MERLRNIPSTPLNHNQSVNSNAKQRPPISPGLEKLASTHFSKEMPPFEAKEKSNENALKHRSIKSSSTMLTCARSQLPLPTHQTKDPEVEIALLIKLIKEGKINEKTFKKLFDQLPIGVQKQLFNYKNDHLYNLCKKDIIDFIALMELLQPDISDDIIFAIFAIPYHGGFQAPEKEPTWHKQLVFREA